MEVANAAHDVDEVIHLVTCSPLLGLVEAAACTGTHLVLNKQQILPHRSDGFFAILANANHAQQAPGE